MPMGEVSHPHTGHGPPPERDAGGVTAYQGFAQRKREDEYLSHSYPLSSLPSGPHEPSPARNKRTRSLVKATPSATPVRHCVGWRREHGESLAQISSQEWMILRSKEPKQDQAVLGDTHSNIGTSEPELARLKQKETLLPKAKQNKQKDKKLRLVSFAPETRLVVELC